MGEEKWPGIHCLHMRENLHDFMEYCIPSKNLNFLVTLTSTSEQISPPERCLSPTTFHDSMNVHRRAEITSEC